MNYQDLAFIILNYNSYELTTKAVNNILSFNFDSKIIVVDNASNDNSWDALYNKFNNVSNVHLIRNSSNVGYANGNNVGLYEIEKEFSNIKYVVIENPDVEIPDSKVIEDLYQKLESNPDIAVITSLTRFNGKIDNPNQCAWKYPNKIELSIKGSTIGSLFKYKNNGLYIYIYKPQEITYVDVVQGCFFMTDYNVFKDIGFFDTNTFLYYEEHILAKKLDKIHKKKAVATDVFINHSSKSNIKINKTFDSSCYHNSRTYYINNYSDYSKIFCIITTAYLKIDLLLKHFLYKFIYKNQK